MLPLAPSITFVLIVFPSTAFACSPWPLSAEESGPAEELELDPASESLFFLSLSGIVSADSFASSGCDCRSSTLVNTRKQSSKD